MKSFILLFFTLLTPAFAKDVYNYTCPIDKEKKAEITLLDRNNPSIALFYKNSRFASCQFEKTPMSREADANAQVVEAQLHLKLISCTYYFEEHKDKIQILETVQFTQSKKKNGSYLTLSPTKNALLCQAKK